ncbi:MAG: phage tail protein [Sphingobacteriales bacterium]|nr:MAG: phage tail protein [Sphingobacteriales bacterium]
MEAYISEIRVFAFGIVPRGWAACNGQLLPINTNQALFSLLGTTFGGDGRTTFALPNLQGKVMLDDGTNTTSGASYPMGATAGTENVTLLATQIPQHNHMLRAYDGLGSTPLNNNDDHLTQLGVFVGNQTSQLYAVNGYTPQPTSLVALQPNTITTTGGSQPHTNMMPYQTVNICMCISGIFPSRD